MWKGVSLRNRWIEALAVLILAIAAVDVRAAGVTHTWSSGTFWSTADWGVNGVPLNAPGDIATNATAGTNTLQLDVDVTIGQLTKSGSSTWNLQDVHTFTMDNTGGVANVFGTNEAAISNNSGSGVMTVGPDVLLTGDLSIGTAGGTGGVQVNGSIYANTDTTLYLRANSSNGTTAVISLIGSIANQGAGHVSVQNVGTSTGVVVISAQLNANTGAVTQNSATSPLTLSGNNGAFTAGVSLQAGTLKLGSATALGAAASTLTISDGTTLDTSTTSAVTLNNANAIVVNGNFSFAGTGALTFTNSGVSLGTAVGTTRTLNVGGSNALTFGGAISNGTTANSLTKAGSGTLTLQGANAYTGTTTVNGGTLVASGAGAISTSSGIVLNGGKLSLDYTGAAANASVNRIGDSASMTLRAGAELLVTNNATASTTTSETFGNLVFDSGNVTVTLSGGVASVMNTVAAGSVSRSNNATVLIRGTNLSAQASNAVRLTINGTTGTGLDLVGASTSSAGNSSGSVKTLRIIPWVVGDTAVAGTGTGFVTYDANVTSGGIRPLGSGEYTPLVAGYTTAASPENVRAFNGTISTNSAVTVNSLSNSGANNILNGSGGALIVNSGAVGGFGANTFVIASGFSKLTLGNGMWNEGVITAAVNSVTINTPIDVTGGGGLTKSGASTLTLTAANLYTGATNITQGTLQVGNGSALGGSIAGSISIASGATLAYNFGNTTGTYTQAGTVSGAGNVAYTSTATATTQGGAVVMTNPTFSGNITYAMTGAGVSALVLQGSVDQQISGVVNSTSNSGILAKTGTSTLTLSGANGTGFGIRMNGGRLVLDFSSSNVAKLSTSNGVQLGGGTISLSGGSGFTQTISNAGFLAGGGNTLINQTNGGSNKIALGTITFASGHTLNLSNDTVATTTNSMSNGLLSFRATVGSGSSSRFATISSNAIIGYTGATSVTSVNSMTSGTANYETTGFTTSTLTASASANSLRYANVSGGSIDLGSSGGNVLTVASILNVGGTLAITRSGSSSGSVNSGTDLVLQGSGDFNIAVPITGGGLTITSGGTVTLSGANTYIGATYLSAGTLSISSNTNLGRSVAGDGSLQVYLNGGTLQATANMSLDDGANFRTFNVGGNGGGTFDVADTKTLTIGGKILNTVLQATPTIIAYGSLTKTGLGTLTLSNSANTYSDATQIKAGTLALVTTVNNNISTSRAIIVGTSASENGATLDISGVTGAGGFQVAAGQTLAGHGSVTGGAVTAASGSTLAPGNSSAGRLTVAGNVTLNAGASFTIDVNGKTTAGTDYDQLVISGDHNVALGGSTLTIAMGTFSATLGDKIYLVNNSGAGTTAGTFAGLAEGARIAALDNLNGFNWTITYAAAFGGGSANDVALVAVTAPEPVGTGFITLATTVLLRRRRVTAFPQ